MKIVIIEDEKLTAKDLADTIKEIEPSVEIMAILQSVKEALAFFNHSPSIDLIFSDIELGDGLSFEIFNKTNNQIPIIFCTAYQQYTLEAFQSVGIDYILKPFNKSSVEKTMIKYKILKDGFRKPSSEMDMLLAALKSNLYGINPSVIVHQGDKVIPISGSNIALFFLENDTTFAYTFEQKRYLISQKLDTLEKTFSATFFRANRQFLINRKAVKDASHFSHRKMIANLMLPFPEHIVVGKVKAVEFIKWLERN